MIGNLLNTIKWPADLRRLEKQELPALATQLRTYIIELVSRTGGHLGANLGTIEMTIALHYVFNTPLDHLVWDVGHQSYAHKILTGRREAMDTLRQYGGVSGFTNRDESVYDSFGSAHASTAISAACGLAKGAQLRGEKRMVVAVVGDGSLSGGMALEALNNMASLGCPVVVIINDNSISIDPAVGALSRHLNFMAGKSPYQKISSDDQKSNASYDHNEKRLQPNNDDGDKNLYGGNIFSTLGCDYHGVFDGHDVTSMVKVFADVMHQAQEKNAPQVVHVITQKGYGYQPAEDSPDKLHGVGTYDVKTGKPKLIPQESDSPRLPSYSQVFAQTLAKAALSDKDIVAVTAAMPSGTGLKLLQKHVPTHVFDVGIAEQHAVTFSAGLAVAGMKVVTAIYSTFLQRAVDQVIHDVALQKIPVRFALDRAGLVGNDGPTHAGIFDVGLLTSLPGMIVMCAGDEADLARMVVTSLAIDDCPSAFRYPRGNGVGVSIPKDPEPLTIGKGRIMCEGNDLAVLSVGSRLQTCLTAASVVKQLGISVTVADARFIKPLDMDLITHLINHHPSLLVIDDSMVGGFGSYVTHHVMQARLPVEKLICRCLPDRWIGQGSTEKQYQDAQLDVSSLVMEFGRVQGKFSQDALRDIAAQQSSGSK